MHAQDYIHNVSEPVAIPHLLQIEIPIVLQEDMQDLVQRQSLPVSFVLPSPTRSPDPSPIDHVCDMIEGRSGQLPWHNNGLESPKTRHEVQLAWDSIPQEDTLFETCLRYLLISPSYEIFLPSGIFKAPQYLTDNVHLRSVPRF